MIPGGENHWNSQLMNETAFVDEFSSLVKLQTPEQVPGGDQEGRKGRGGEGRKRGAFPRASHGDRHTHAKIIDLKLSHRDIYFCVFILDFLISKILYSEYFLIVVNRRKYLVLRANTRINHRFQNTYYSSYYRMIPIFMLRYQWKLDNF